ncbi:hypothetical protein H3C61_01755 [Candidatus Gracilibacteria bacterium]|nr:hypothetical protein [Candidatus Gracilibacteria bacterium]
METKEYVNTQRQDYTLEGVYGDKEIKISAFPSENNDNIVINIHGTFGSLTGSNDKYLHFAQEIQQNQLAGSVLYASSRKNVELDSTITDRYKQKQARFLGKTFHDELEDARRVVMWVIENVSKNFGIQREKLKITLNGNSLGGILAFYLASEFPEIKNISTVGTGLRLEIKDVPILNTFPDASEIIQKLQGFRGKFLMQYGDKDDVFTPEAFESFYKNVGTQEKSFLHMLGVDHTFGKVSGETSSTPYKQVFESLKTLLKTGELVSGELNMHTEVQQTVSDTKGLVDGALLDSYFSPDNDDIKLIG